MIAPDTIGRGKSEHRKGAAANGRLPITIGYTSEIGTGKCHRDNTIRIAGEIPEGDSYVLLCDLEKGEKCSVNGTLGSRKSAEWKTLPDARTNW